MIVMYDNISEKVRVLAVFERGVISPRLFRWSSRDYKIMSVSMRYQEKNGASINHYFSVETEDGGVFKLVFNDKLLTWTLEEVWKDK